MPWLSLKYGFCKKSLRKNETLISTDLEKKGAKSVQISDFLQNPYFSILQDISSRLFNLKESKTD